MTTHLPQMSPLLNDDILETVLEFCEWNTVTRLAPTCRAVRSQLAENEAGWRAMVSSLAREKGLFIPRKYDGGWKHYFWDHLWPARSGQSQNFNIRVAARFRPAESKTGVSGTGLHLPLHQRVRLVKQGKIQPQQLFEHSQGPDKALIRTLAENGQLSPELLQAVMDASYLESATLSAEQLERRELGLAPLWQDTAADAPARVHNMAALRTPAAAHRQESTAALAGGQEADGTQGQGHGTHGISNSATERQLQEAELRGPRTDSKETTGQTKAQLVAVLPTRVVMFLPGVGVRPFLFSRVVDSSTQQEKVYQSVARDSVLAAINGFNACLMCYGQTGSGKTYTMFGPPGALERESDNMGVVPRAMRELLEATQAPDHKSKYQRRQGLAGRPTKSPECPMWQWADTDIVIQYVQIYQEQITDLTTGNPVRLRLRRGATGTEAFLSGAAECRVRTLDQVMDILRRGERMKLFATTAMNHRSSRAHTVFLVRMRRTHRTTRNVTSSRLFLVDLAGCEQVKQSQAVGQRFREAVGINSSLLVLGKVIRSLAKAKPHVPYTESKLTALLKAALGGNSRTTAIVTCSSDAEHAGQTLHALRFGERCALIANQAEVSSMSAEEALQQVREALDNCQEHIRLMEERGTSHLPLYSTLKERFTLLSQRLAELGHP